MNREYEMLKYCYLEYECQMVYKWAHMRQAEIMRIEVESHQFEEKTSTCSNEIKNSAWDKV